MPIIKDDPAFSGDYKGFKMKVQENQDLKLLAVSAGKEPTKLSLEIYESLEMWDLLDGSGDYWGFAIKDCIKDETVIDLILCGLSIKPTQENNDRFLNLILMLDGDCPECGSELEIDPERSEYKHVYGDGIETPDEYEPIVEVYKCTHCDYSDR